MMTAIRRLLLRFAAHFRRAEIERELDEEYAAHIDLATADNVARGMTPEEARRRALVSFGGRDAAKELHRESRSLPGMSALARDIRYAWRMMMRSPVFTAVVVTTLAVGIGANTAVFSVVHAVLLEPLPYPDADRLAVLWTRQPQLGTDRQRLSYPLLTHWSEQARGRALLAGFRIQPMDIVIEGAPERLTGRLVTPDYFRVLGATAARGRNFEDSDALPSSEPVVLLSHKLWRDRFDGDLAVIGRPIELDGDVFHVVGVMPRDFQDLPSLPGLGTADTDFWAPISPRTDRLARGDFRAYTAVARLSAETTIDAAAAMWETGLGILTDDEGKRTKEMSVELVSLRSNLTQPARPALLLLFGAVGAVLLIACSNVAHLLLARASKRRAEIAVRASLGASRGRLVRQLGAESLVLGLAGGLAGVGLAWLGLDTLLASLPVALPPTSQVSLSWEALGFTGLVALAASFSFGLAPAWFASRADFRSILHARSEIDGLGGGRVRLGGLLAATQMAGALALLIAGGLLIKSFWLLTRVDTGFEPRNVLTVGVSLPRARYAEPARRVAFYQEVERRLRSLPAVEAAGVVNLLPLSGAAIGEVLTIEGRPLAEHEQQPEVRWNQVSPAYFDAMRIELTDGRPFTDQDIASRASVTIVNETLAERYWPGEQALGKRVRFGPPSGPWSEVVGVVADVKHLGLEEESEPQAYSPYSDLPPPNATFVVRSQSKSDAIAELVRQEVAAVDPALPVVSIQTMEQVLAKSLSRSRSFALLLGVFAGIALFVAAIGVYGVVHFSVSRRIHEMGIRRALGAQTSDILGLVLWSGARVTVLGLAFGVAGGLALSRTLAGELYEIAPSDWGTYVLAVLVVAGIAGLASYLPARRATRVDPMTALRYE